MPDAALKSLLSQMESLISAAPLFENRIRCLELLRAASTLAEDRDSRRGNSQPEMDDAAKRVRPELEQNWRTWTIRDLAVWWERNFWPVGHKRLGRMLIEITGVKQSSGVPISDEELKELGYE
jgi:hypothetical protein